MEREFLVLEEDVCLLLLYFQMSVLRLRICHSDNLVLLVILRSTLFQVRSK